MTKTKKKLIAFMAVLLEPGFHRIGDGKRWQQTSA